VNSGLYVTYKMTIAKGWRRQAEPHALIASPGLPGRSPRDL